MRFRIKSHTFGSWNTIDSGDGGNFVWKIALTLVIVRSNLLEWRVWISMILNDNLDVLPSTWSSYLEHVSLVLLQRAHIAGIAVMTIVFVPTVAHVSARRIAIVFHLVLVVTCHLSVRYHIFGITSATFESRRPLQHHRIMSDSDRVDHFRLFGRSLTLQHDGSSIRTYRIQNLQQAEKIVLLTSLHDSSVRYDFRRVFHSLCNGILRNRFP